ncbi:MAG: NYN domain-containing protein [Proteobacteria bacterium]|nr:NYN domain-containing protein [Pseudomonadota bacterium]
MDLPAAAPRPAVGNLAVFIDADNLSDPTALDHALLELRQRAERILYKRAYGRAESLKAIESVLWRHGVRPVANMIVNKVTTDSALVIDAVEAVCTNRIDAVAICSGDADFVPLATWLREKGCRVFCYSLERHIFANPESFYDDVVLMELVEPAPPEPPSVTPLLPPAPSAVVPPAPAAPRQVTVAQVLAAFPGLRDGQPQPLNLVVAALRQQGLLGKNTKTVAWFAQFGRAFALSPPAAPNRISHFVQPAGAAAPVAQLAAARLRANAPLLLRLHQAIAAVQDGGGWAGVQAVRAQLGSKQAFDPRAHGFASLSKLLAASEVFELRAPGTPLVAVRSTSPAVMVSGRHG